MIPTPATTKTEQQSAPPKRGYVLNPRDFLIALQEQEEFGKMAKQMINELEPANCVEATIFEELLVNAWNMRRLRRLENALQESLDPIAALDDEALQEKIDRVARRHAAAERSYYRALKELKALQTERHNRPTMTPAYPDDISPLVNSIEISKRTQAKQRFHRDQFSADKFQSPYPRPRRNTVLQNEPNAAKTAA